jgi:Ca-activated chloride channel family protein
MVLILVLLAVGISPITGFRATAQDVETDSEEVVNVELIVDVSGSMAQTLPGGETRIDAAQRVLAEVVTGIPEREGVNVGLRVYGHKGDNTEAGREESCKSSELVADIEPVDQSEDDPKDRAPEPRR